MGPWCSMVRYEIQRRASSRRGPSKAFVGQPSRQRVQLPQRARMGSSGGSSALVTIAEHGERFRVGVGLHPSFCTTDAPDSPHLGVPSYTGSLYIGFGSEDQMQPASANGALIEFTNALDKGEAEIHDGANHGFGVYGGGYHEAAADRSYERIKAMLDHELG